MNNGREMRWPEEILKMAYFSQASTLRNSNCTDF
jgi:hypothetical protein